MVISKLKLAIFGWMLLHGSTLAAKADDVPDPRVWAQQLSQTTWSNTPGLVQNFTLLLPDAAGEKEWAAVTENLADLGFLQFVPVSAYSYYRYLNPAADGSLGPEDPKLSSVPVQLLLKVKDQGLAVHLPQEGQLRVEAQWELKASDRASAEAFYRWLVAKLNYDAIVLDVKDELILAALLLPRKELGQGLLLKNPREQYFVEPGRQLGEGLVQMLRIEGNYAVLESMDARSPKPGSKIVLGQIEKLKGLMRASSSESKTAPNEEKTPEAPTPRKAPAQRP